jgi:DNA-directed RNA polymerase subunit M/transcription elongation factor TFIIS
MVKKKYLVVTGVPSIKKYVFGTDQLKEIRGASALLEDLTRNRIIEYLKSYPQLEIEPVFVGGGAGQFIIYAKEEDLNTHLKTLEGEFLKATHGGVRLSWGKALFEGNNYRQTLIRAEMNAMQKTEEAPFHPFARLHTGFIRECDSCDGMVSAQSQKKGEGDSLLCDICRAKREFNYEKARKNFLNELSEYLKAKGLNVEPAQDFDQVGAQCKTRPGYTALVYADGNAMGKLIKTIDRKDLFKFFSRTVDTSIKEACFEALFEACFFDLKQSSGIIPAEILMLGGDDLLVYLTAETAFPFAVKVAEKFNAITKKKMEATEEGEFFLKKTEGKGLYISIGIAFGKSHTPFSILLHQAEELLSFAKKAGSNDLAAGEYYAPAYIDYHLSTSYNNQINVADSRINHLEIPGKQRKKPIRLYQKPYSLADAKALLESARKLVQSGIPKTRLNRLGNALVMGKMNGTLECLKLYTRTQADQPLVIWDILDRFDCIGNMPWNEAGIVNTTMLVDLMELVGFCGNDNINAGKE